MKDTRIAAPLIALFALILAAWGPITTPDGKAVRSDLQRLIARKKIVVALIDTDYPPLFTTDQNGQLVGHDIDLVRQLAEALGVQAEFVRRARSFDGVIDIVSRGEADIGLGTSLTLERTKKVLFSQPYMTLNMALLLNRRRLIDEGIMSELTDLGALRHTTQKIGLLIGSAYKDYARQTFPKAELREYPSLSTLIAAVNNGELLAAVRNDLTARIYLHRHPATILHLQLFIDPSSKDYVAFSVRPNNPHLLFWLNAYLMLNNVNRTSSALVEQYKRLE